MTLNSGTSDVEVNRAARTLRSIIIRGNPLSILHHCFEGKRSARNDPVLLRNHLVIYPWPTWLAFRRTFDQTIGTCWLVLIGIRGVAVMWRWN